MSTTNGSSSSSASGKKPVFENSTPVKASRGHKTKFQKLNNSEEMTDGGEVADKNAQVPVIGTTAESLGRVPTVPNSSSSDQSIDDESLDDSPIANYPFYQEINVSTNNVYTDYQNSAVPVQIGSPYYVYPSAYTQAPEYQLLNTPQQNCSLYQTYVYDPNICAYTLNTYSSPQQQQQQTQQLSSPQQQQQQQTSLLGSYQTPRQPQNLYNMASSCMSPMDSTVPTSNESSSNSPCQYQYVMYPTQNAYLSPMAAPHAYMMYQPAPPTLQQTPTSIPSERNRPRRNNKRSANKVKENNLSFSPNEAVYHASSNASPVSNQDQHLYQQHHQPNNNSHFNQQQQVDEQNCQGMYMETMYPSPVSMCSPAASENPYAFCDPNNGMFNLQNYYDYVNGGIQSFGDDNDDEDQQQEQELEEENEQLACYTCRGRRMCFCYFLKVRYYKFPSFLDLVDHQYKKWRQNMMKAKKSN